jgi:outer membrane lipoprotein SlyB
VAVSGCTVMPTGPSVMVLPGNGKTFDEFRADDNSCRQYAFQQVGGVTTQEAANKSAIGSAVVGTAVGAAAGAAFGGGSGAAIGSGAGLLAGSAIGGGNAQGSAYTIQRRYDIAYIQCMYAAGHRVPLPRGYY